MSGTRSTLIRTAHGSTRVYRPFVERGVFCTLRYQVPASMPMCQRCGCVEGAACFEGCGWADAARTICTRCAERIAR